MRNITKIMADAFKEGNPKVRRLDNTEVSNDGEFVTMRLHGHAIAIRPLTQPELLIVSMCGWATPTTRERLNAVMPDGLRVYQHNGEQHWQARSGDDWRAEGIGSQIDPKAVYVINSVAKTVEVYNG